MREYPVLLASVGKLRVFCAIEEKEEEEEEEGGNSGGLD